MPTEAAANSSFLTYDARYFVYHVSEWEWTIERKQRTAQNGLEKEWLMFSKPDEQASVRPIKWKRWSAARREEHRGRMWGHIQETGAGQLQAR